MRWIAAWIYRRLGWDARLEAARRIYEDVTRRGIEVSEVSDDLERIYGRNHISAAIRAAFISHAPPER